MCVDVVIGMTKANEVNADGNIYLYASLDFIAFTYIFTLLLMLPYATTSRTEYTKNPLTTQRI